MRFILIIINLLCAVMHVLFEIYVFNSTNEFASFILVENLLVTFFFLGMAYLVFLSKKNKKYLLVNLWFWVIFEISVLAFRPKISTLEVIKDFVPVSQWIELSIFGGATIVASLVGYKYVR